MMFSRKKLLSVIVTMVLCVSAVHAFAAGNISSVQKFSQFYHNLDSSQDIDIDKNGINDFINWVPTCGGTCPHPVDVTNIAVTGDIFGESVGWIRLNPDFTGVTPPGPDICNGKIGVRNNCSGTLSGCAWGQNTGWINFSPTGTINTINQPKINTTTGKISGTVWAQNYGWISLSSPESPTGYGSYNPSLGLVTTWDASTCVDPVDFCPNIDGDQENIPNGKHLDGSGNCIDDSICTGSSCIGGGGPSFTVVKNVVIANGGTATPDQFISKIHITDNGVIQNPTIIGNVMTLNPIAGHTYKVTEDATVGYNGSFGATCPGGVVTFPSPASASDSVVCVLTNYDSKIPPLVPGCTIKTATNYNQYAAYDDGTCKFKSDDVLGCTIKTATNYNKKATVNDGTCKFNNISGCTKFGAINYNKDAVVDDGSCLFAQIIEGCTNSLATNYNKDATKDDGSCIFKDVPVDDSSIGTAASGILQNFIPSNGFKIGGLILAIIGLLGSIPGLITRFGNLWLTLVFGRKRRRGIVYDSVTKEPLDPVYVSVIDMVTGKEIANQITDIEGRYGFVLKKGAYKIIASKTHYQFPSLALAGKTEDPVYDNLYFGEVFTIENEEDVTVMNIPMDPLATDWNQDEKHRMHPMRYLMHQGVVWGWITEILFIVGFIASLIITYHSPVWWNILMVALYVIITLLQLFGFGPIHIGIIKKQGLPLPYAIIRVFNSNLNREIAHKVTNELGGYYALVPKAHYYVTVEQKNPDGTYTNVFTSNVMNAGGGVINKSFNI